MSYMNRPELGELGGREEDFTPVVAKTEIQDNYDSFIRSLYDFMGTQNTYINKAAQWGYNPSSFEEFKKAYEGETPPTLTIKDTAGKPMVEMKPDSCILHHPFDAGLLNTVAACYKSFEVSQCGSLDDAIALQKAMPGLKFTQNAIDGIKNSCINPTPEVAQKLNAFIAAIVVNDRNTQDTPSAVKLSRI